MDLNLRSIGALVSQQISDAKSTSTALALSNTSTGSVLKAIFNSVGAVGAWFQATALDVLRASRLTSSTGRDVDSWMADFKQTRLPANASAGTVFFSRFSASLPSAIPVGTLIKTGDNTLTFVVTLDTTNQRYNPTTNAYEIPADTYGLFVPAQAIVPGIASNIIAGAMGQITSNVGFDNVTNETAFAGGKDAETDIELKKRFHLYIASLSKATLVAIQAAISSVQQGLRYVVQINTDPSGAFRPGHMTITIDDGSGSPTAALITAVAAKVDAVKALAETYSVLGPTHIVANISLYYEVADGIDHDIFLLPIKQAITNHIETLNIGQTLRYSRIYSLVFNISDNITNVAGISINGVPQDLVAGLRGLIVPGTIEVG